MIELPLGDVQVSTTLKGKYPGNIPELPLRPNKYRNLDIEIRPWSGQDGYPLVEWHAETCESDSSPRSRAARLFDPGSLDVRKNPAREL